MPNPSGGGGGWDLVALPMRDPPTVWRGRRELIVQSIPIVLGGFATNLPGVDGHEPVQRSRQTLLNMYRPDDPADEPPVVKIDTRGDAVMLQQLDYVITSLDWGDAEADPETMERLQQAVTVELTEYVPDVRLTAKHSAKGKAKGKGGMPAVYTVKRGDTLSGIAARYKVKGGWRAIADAQKPRITDPRALKVGQKLRRPK